MKNESHHWFPSFLRKEPAVLEGERVARLFLAPKPNAALQALPQEALVNGPASDFPLVSPLLKTFFRRQVRRLASLSITLQQGNFWRKRADGGKVLVILECLEC